MVKFLVWGSEDLNYVTFLALLQTISLSDLSKSLNLSVLQFPFSVDGVADLVILDNERFHVRATIYSISTREALTQSTSSKIRDLIY